MKLIFKATILAGGLAAAPFTYSSANGLTTNDAACMDGGTCCPETGPICYPGACESSECAVANHYWIETGQCID